MRIPSAVAAAAAAVEDKPREKREYAPLTPGRYTARLLDVTPGEASTGSIFAELKFSIVGGEFDNRWVSGRLYFTEKNAFRVKSWIVDGLGGDLDGNISDLVGRTAELVLTEKDYVTKDGEARKGVEIRYINRPKTDASVSTPDAAKPVTPLF